MTGSMARKESAPERMGGVSEPGRQKQYLFTNSDLKRLIAPLIVEQILAVTVGMVDTMMVSSAGEAATSGVSLVDMINNLLINVFAAVSTGGAVVSSQFLGQKNRKRACEAADQLMMITGLISIVIMARFMACPGSTPIPSRLLATALAAICVVPKMAMMLTTSTRPSWKLLFSIPPGIPI